MSERRPTLYAIKTFGTESRYKAVVALRTKASILRFMKVKDSIRFSNGWIDLNLFAFSLISSSSKITLSGYVSTLTIESLSFSVLSSKIAPLGRFSELKPKAPLRSVN